MTQNAKLGFVGLGGMGHAMAARLLAAGHEVSVFNRTRAKADDLVARGARWAETPADLAQHSDIVFSMLFDDAATQQATFAPDGIAAGLAPGAVHVCCSTISLPQARLLRDGHAARGQAYVSAPVLGRPPAAQSGQLFVLAAGEEPLLARLDPFLQCFATRIFSVGQDPVQANLIKLSLNFMIFSTIEQMSEVFAANEKAGTEASTLLHVMTESFFNAPVHRNYGTLMVDRHYDSPGASVKLGLKDTQMFLQAGSELAVPLPYASVVRDRFLAAISAGDAERDFAVLRECARRDSGL